MSNSARAMDLGTAWLEQYAPEVELFAAPVAAAAQEHLGRLDGYLSSTDLAFLYLSADPSKAAGEVEPFVREQLARAEAEFSGRIVRSADDLARLAREPRGHLTWALLALERAGGWLDGDERRLDSIASWIDRGVRLVALDGANSVAEALDRLATLAAGPARLAADLGGLSAADRETALAWFEQTDRPIGLVVSRVAWAGEVEGRPGEIGAPHASRVGALGGLIGLSPTTDLDKLGEAVETLKQLGFGPGDAGAIGLASDFPAPRAAGTTGQLAEWARERLGASDAAWLLAGSARGWLGRWLGG